MVGRKYLYPHLLLRSAVALCAAEILLPSLGYGAELPSGSHVVAGRADVRTPTPKSMVIRQRTQKAIINWDDFSIGALSSVRFDQPGKNAAVLNRVTGDQISRIQGLLSANAKIYLINPRGVLIGPNGKIQTGSFVAATLSAENSAFLDGSTLMFMDADNSAGDVVNRGVIRTSTGDVVLIGKLVRNSGDISAPSGNVSVATGSVVELYRQGDDERLSVRVKDGTGAIDNSGSIQATAVEMQANGGNPYALAINNDGLVRASTVTNQGGRILLKASTGTIQQNGTIDASAPTRKGIGGDIMIVGENILLTDQSVINVSGGAGGGKVRVGTESDWNKILPLDAATKDISSHVKPGDADLTAQQAIAVVIAPGAIINADALQSGDGGRVTVWSEQFTNFAGKINANAKRLGDGGWVETSSRQILDATGIVYAIAPSTRRRGMWLMDPYNVSITTSTSNGSFSGANPNVFTPTANTAKALNTTIESSLNSGTDVTINTGASGAQNGDITISSSISKTSGGDATLWLAAANDIINTGSPVISSTSNKLHVVLQSDADGSGTGKIKFTNSLAITSNGGDLTMSGGNYSLANLQSTGYAMNTVGGTGAIELGASTSFSTSTGNIYLRGKGVGTGATYYDGMDLLGGSISTTTGNINITAVGGSGSSSNNDGIYMTGGTISSSGGAISITTTGSTTATTSNGFRGCYIAGTIQNSGTGTITINATGGSAAGGTGNYGMNLNAGKIQSNGSGAITLNITPGNGSAGLYTGAATGYVGLGSLTGSYTGTLTINCDNINLANTTSIAGSGALVIKPSTNATTIGLGASATGTLNLDATELGYIADGFSSITIGSSTGTGAIDVRAVTFKDSVLIQSPATGGTITVNGALATGSGSQVGLITLRAANSVSIASGGITTQGYAIDIDSDYDSTGTGDFATSASTSIAGNGGDITITTTTATLGGGTIASSGNLTIQPKIAATTIGLGASAVGTLNLDATELGYFSNGFNSITIGGTAASASNMDVRTVAFTDPVTLRTTARIDVNGALSTGSTTSAGSIWLRAGNAVNLAAGGSVTTQGQDIVLNGDWDASGNGGVIFASGTSVTSNGGNIIVGGGSSPSTTVTYGTSGLADSALQMDNATMSSGAGTITINAQGRAGSAGSRGVYMLNGAQISSTSGDITVTATGGAATSTNQGVYLTGANTKITTSTGAISITATGAGSSSNNPGLQLDSSGAITATSTGTIAITATGAATAAGTDNHYGVYVNSGSISVANGDLTINGTGGGPTGANQYGFYIAGGSVTSSGSGNISITGANTNGSAGIYVGGGSVTASSTGNITLTGSSTTGSSGDGITLAGGSVYTSSGTLSLTGTSGAASAIKTTGTPAIGNASQSGSLTITGDSVTLSSTTTVSGSGALLLQPSTTSTTIGLGLSATGTFNLDATEVATLQDGFSSITIGRSDSAGAIDVRALTFKDTILIRTPASAGTVTVNGALATGSTTQVGNITLQAGSNITVASGASITSQAMPIVLNSDRDGNSAGYISLSGGITSNGGDIILSGGSGANNAALIASGAAYSATAGTPAVSITNGVTVSSGAGNIYINGTGGTGGASAIHGVNLDTGATVSSTSGAINVIGIAPTTGSAGTQYGVYLNTGYITSTSGNITVTGTASTGATGSDQGGLRLTGSGSKIQTGSTGTINITGTGGAAGSGSNNTGIRLGSGTAIQSNGSGNITFSVYAGNGSPAFYTSTATNYIGLGQLAGSYTGNITINADSILLTGANIAGSGTLTIQPTTASTTIGLGASATGTLNLDNTELSYLQDGFSSITIGKSNAGAIDSRAYTYTDNLTLLTAGNITINGATSVGTNNLTLNSGGTVTQAAAVTANGLALLGGGAFTLTNTSNSITTLAGSTAAMSVYDSGALTVGTVGSTNGITATGAVTLQTASTKDVTLSQAISSSVSGNSVVIASGNNFVNSGSAAITTASGRWLIYSASPLLNTNGGLTGTKRYNKTYAGYPPASVTETGNVFLYSIAPTITITADNLSKTYGAVDPTLTYTVSGLIDSDTIGTATTGSPSISRVAGSNTGTYTITPSAGTLASTMGYTLAYATGTFTINPATLTVTAAAKSKTYGGSDPTLTYTYSGLVNGDTSAVFSGSLSRTAGENVGTYAINQGTVSAGSNYTISYVSNNLTISAATLTVTAAAKSKTYGGADPALTYTYSGLTNGDTASVFFGSLSRTAGENVGTYAINQGTVTAGSNYTISYVSNNLTISPATLTITAAAKSKTYGAVDPALTYTYSGLVNSDTSAVISGSLTRTAGENVGTYAINQGSVTAGSNYTISYVSNNLTIGTATLTVTAAAKSKTYGGADPALTYTYSGLVNSDTAAVFSGSLSRTTGENVGTYAINQGTVTAGSNYTISYVSDNLTINPATLTVTAAAKSKSYGAADPALTYTYSGLVNSDTASVFSGSLTRTAGENVGTYAINQGTVTAGSNYTISYVSNNFTIGTATLTVTAAAKSKTYGGADPSLTYTYSGLTNGDTAAVFSGSLTRTAGENVGTYAINQGSVTAGSNYTISYVSNNLTINPATLTVTAAAKSKTYGAADPALTYTYSGLVNSDTAAVFSGSLSRTAGENVGTYAINQGTVTAGSNYTISYVSNNLTIGAATLTVTASSKSKTYGGADPSLTYTYSGLTNGDTAAVFSGSLTRTAGENVGTYAINQGSLTAGSNYSITYVSDNLTINPATLTVTAAAKSKTYGAADPALTYTYSGLVNSDTASVFSGSLARTAGENVGTYAINQGTVTAGSNYTISYVSNNLTINPATLTVTADAKSKTYGASDPSLTYTYSGLANGDTSAVFSGSLSRTAGENVGTYAINQGSVTAGSNYTISYVSDNLTINPATLTVNAANKSKTYGAVDPALTYTYSGLVNSDTSSVFSGSLTRTAGENVGSYSITQGSLSAGSNYTISYAPGTLTINAASLTVTADAKSKTYGAADPSLTYTYSGLANGDTAAVFSGALARTAGENVGTYAINQGSLTAGSNYTITYVSDNLTINPATLTVNAVAKSKTYGSADPALTYTYSGLTNSDTASVFTGALTRTSGENVGTYAINQGTLSASSNYTISYNSANLTINAATLTVTAAAKSKTYGAADPALTYSYSGLTNGDTAAVFSGSLARTAGENVGTYAINQGSLTAGSNYSITYVSDNLTINPATLTVTAAAKLKTYGAADPALTYTYSGLVNSDTSAVFSGSLSRTAGENVGTYAINQGSLSAGSNYTISYVSDNLTINPASLTVTAAAKSKTYGDVDPALTYTYSGLVNSDTASVFSGSLARTAGENVGTYAINQGSLTAGSNYTITYVSDNLTINPATLTVNATAKSKTYGGADPALTYTYSGLTNGDTSAVFTGALARAAGENVGTYAINQNTLSAGSNYTISYNSASFTINAATLTVTADAKSKTYGAVDPSLTYTYSGLSNGDTAAVFSGSLTRAAGENVGTYAINQGSLTAGSNYSITYVSDNLTINPATLTVTAAAKSKTYGSADPALTYTYSGLANGDTAAVFSGSLTRAAGENVGTYAINQGTVTAGSNYTISYVGNNLTINAASLTVTAAAKSKTYGAVDPSLTYTYSGLTNGDTSAVFSGSLARTAGENVGTYAINQGSLSAGSNYTITYVSDNLTINPATLTVNAVAKSKTYGGVDPALTYTYSGLTNGDTAAVFTGALARTAGENVGTYTINQNTLSAGSNYSISYNSANFTISAATLTVTADAKSKTYGAVDPSLTYTYSGLSNGDTSAVFSGSLTRAAGENVGTYAINQGSLTAGSNYTINYISDNLTINPATLTVNAVAKSKTYGSADPALTYTYSGLVNGDTSSVFTGSLARTAGENVGTYAINQGTVSAGSNYTISYNSANLTINAASLTVTADAKSKTYGAADPALTYTYSGLTNSDTSSVFSGSLARAAGENVGSYAINQGSLTASSNYTITYVSDNLTINPATLTVTAAAKSKTYGAVDPALTYTYSGLTNGDTAAVFSGSLSRAAGQNVGTYAINQGTVTAGSNYTISYVGDNLTINPASLTVTADAKSKTYGAIDPSLTYTYSGLANGDTSSVFSGSLARAAGENVGTYAINQGSLTAGSNYSITYVSDNLTINPASLTVTAVAKSKTYGAVDPALTYTYSGLVNSDTATIFTGSLSRTAGENVGTYAINQGSLTAGSNYSITYVSDNLTINPATLTVTADAKSKTYGSADPALTYSYTGLTNGDTSSVFSGSLARAAGENVGSYAINQGSVTAGSNYSITYVSDNLTVTAATLTVNATAKSKTYGSADPALTYTYSGLTNGDTAAVFSGALTRSAGENVGAYAINQGTVTAGSNYTIVYNTADLTINPAALTITADAKSKTYGDADPALTYTYSGLTNGDTSAVFSGSLTRTAGENVGAYAINQGTVSAGSNYTITYVSDNLTINPATLTVTADAKSKTYGAADPSLTYTYAGLKNGDTASVFSGSLTRNAGENVGTYAINQGTVTASSNYTITYVSDNLTINPASLTITADAKSKTYGSVDPAMTYTYSGLTNGDTAAVFSGSLARAAGENVGAYAINQGTVTAGSNYTITYVGDNLTINPASLTVTADTKSKTYGAVDPALTYTYSGLVNGDTSSVFSGSLARVAGENVGAYAINQGTVTAGSNYTITYVSDNLTINAASLTVTADAKSKTYGSVDPSLTYTYSGLTNGDTATVFSGGLTRSAGENVGTYAINQGSLNAGSNYSITYVSDNLTINPATLTVTAEAKSKTYGAADPALTYTYSGLANGDTAAVFTGALARNAGENVGTYAINQSTLTAGSNYTINYISDNLTINPASLTVTADAQSKVYGDVDPALTYTYTGLTNGDTSTVFSGSLARAAGENVGTYAINQGSLAAGGNYTITYVGDNLTISPATLTVTAAAKTKVYGNTDPALTYTYSGLKNGDTAGVFTGSLTRVAGENVGAYAIQQGSVSAGSNYTISYVGNNLTITPATLTVTADAQSKVYGDTDPSLTYTYSGLANGDTSSVFTGALARAAGENVGTYAINQGSLDAGTNYTISYISDNLTITPATLTVNADVKTKIYGDADPALTYIYAGLKNGDTNSVFTGSLARAAGENVGTYAINQGSLDAGTNYSISYVGNNLTITAAVLTVNADAQSKVYGDADPALTYTYSGLKNGDTNSVFTGSLTRAAGENVGAYAINQGLLDAGANYSISYTGNNLTITAATLTVNAIAQSKTYGDADPALTYTYSGLKNSDTSSVFTGSLARAAGENVGAYAINQGSLDAGANYIISYTGNNLTITPATLTVNADAQSKTYGDADPALTYAYSGLKNGDTNSVFTGSLARIAGENVGSYAINQGSLDAGANYTISYTGNNLTITAATLTVNADAQTKVYGDADPALSYTYSGLKNGDTNSVFTGSLARAAGENVGAYAINQGSLDAGANYTISYTGNNLSITPATLTVNADAQTKVYGDADPALSYTYSGLKNGDTNSVFTGSLARIAGENVGAYAINQSSLDAGANYTISYTGNNLTITPATLTINADAQSKIYGDTDPALTYAYSGLKNGDTNSVFTGALARATGENVGVYAINQGSLDAGANYTISYTGNNLTITAATLTVTADAQSKIYGDVDPALTYTFAGLKNSDTNSVFTGSLVRITGENVGSYAINQGSLDAGANYTISYVGNNLSITPAILTVTADAQSKIYGNADPALTYAYTGLKNGDTNSVFTGSLARVAGENVGAYAINQGSLNAGANYTISYTSNNLTITPATLTVTADAQTKIYGDSDPALTYVYAGLKNGDTNSIFSGSLARTAGENVGTYAINQGSLDAGANYTISYTGNNLTISAATLTVTADAQAKIYGDVDPALTYVYAGLKNGDTSSVFTGGLARAAGENVGSYAINQGSLDAGANYTISYVGNNLAITPATLTVTADAQSKIYGDTDPALTYVYAGLKNGDTNSVFIGSLARIAGENVGAYAINEGSLDAGANYTISYAGNNLTITAATLTVTADAQTKIYGDTDPALSYTYAGLKNGDTNSVFTGSLARAVGENVGTYAINQGSLGAGSNYTISYVGNNLTITPATLTVNADAQSKIYGDADPALNYVFNGLKNGDTNSVFTGSLARTAGENVGTYAINQGSLDAGTNYTISYTGNNLTITPATLTVNANVQSKIYGDVDPALTYVYAGLKNGDTNSIFTGGLARAAGENVGTYSINQGSLDAGANYTISYSGNNLTITAATLTVNADAQTKIYGDIDPALTYTYSGLKNGDTNSVFTGGLARTTGENVGSYAINQGSLDAGANYTISYVGNNLSINPATLTVTADAQTKVYGDIDPALTYAYVGLKNGDTNSVFTGNLARVVGENVGTYAINQGSLDAGMNYTISYVGNNLSITPATLTVNANAQTKVYGSADPALTYAYSGLKNGDTSTVLTGRLARNVGENVGSYTINQGTLDAGANYTISYTGNNLTITPATLTVTADAQTKVYGSIDPSLTYTYAGLQNGDTASVFTGGLARAAGENVGSYAIIQGTLDAGTNYTISYTSNNLTITPATLTVNAVAKTKVYGSVDPSLTYTYSGLQNGDTAAVFTGSLTRSAGENVGAYAINQGSLGAGANYTISYSGSNLTITPATLTVAANAQTKIYGDIDPALTYAYAGLQNGDTAAVFTGSLARAAGENVGSYMINQGSLDAGGNYTITYTGNNLAITPATLVVTAGAKTKIYGNTDPALTYTYSGLKNGDTNSIFTGSLVRTAGENVGSYAINQGTVDAGANYTISYVGNNLTITPVTLTVTADAQNKVYGDIDPALTYTYTGLQNGDTNSVFTGGLARVAGENVGAYAINQGSLDAGANYSISYVSNNLSITPATLTITANAKTKIYGDADPTLTYAYSGFKNGDTSAVLTGALSRNSGENVGSYAINQGTVSAGANYTIAYVSDNLTITPAILTVAANSQTKIYGDIDPALTYAYAGLKNGDNISVFTGSLARIAGENVGSYAINQGSLDAGTNYTISYTGNNLAITPATLTVSAAAKLKIYGDIDPALTYSYAGLKNGDNSSVITGGLTRTAGENVGAYAINQGSLDAGANYTIAYTGNNLTITAATLTVNADAQSKIYGDADPALVYVYSGLKNGDTNAVITGSLTRATGENVGIYAINQGSLDAGANYTIAYTGNNLTITPATLTISADVKTKTYGATDPALTYSFAGLKNGDTSTIIHGALVRNTGENVGTYAINQGSVTTSTNYVINYVTNNLDITPRVLYVTADPKAKVYGGTDPALTYSISGLQFGQTPGQVLSGGLVRDPGENKGVYTIQQGTLTPNGNYTLSYTGNTFTIANAVLNVIADPRSKIYGDADPSLTYQVSGFQNGDDASILTGGLSRLGDENVGPHPVTLGNLDAGANYVINYTSDYLTINRATLNVVADPKTKVYGDADPSLTYTYTGLKNGDTNSIITGSLVRNTGENVGSYAINQGSLDAGGNYTIAYTSDNFLVTPATLTITADGKTKIYGNTDPALTYAYSGLKNNDTNAVITGSLDRTAGENVGNYAINQGTLTAGANYTITYAGDNLTITPAKITVTAADATRIYGENNPSLTYSIAGLKLSDTQDVISGLSVQTSATNRTSVGKYVITASGATASNYTFEYVDANLTITPAHLTIAARDASRVQGTANPEFNYALIGLKFAEDEGQLSSINLNTTATPGSQAGNYLIIASGGLNPNYIVDYTSGTLSIAPAPINGSDLPPLPKNLQPIIGQAMHFEMSTTTNAIQLGNFDRTILVGTAPAEDAIETADDETQNRPLIYVSTDRMSRTRLRNVPTSQPTTPLAPEIDTATVPRD